jgi:Mg2+ and Co2+ transporter CorA
MVNKFGRLTNESASNMAMSKVKYTNFDWIDFDHPEQAELQEVTDGLKLDMNVVGDTIQHGHLPKINNLKGTHLSFYEPIPLHPMLMFVRLEDCRVKFHSFLRRNNSLPSIVRLSNFCLL